MVRLSKAIATLVLIGTVVTTGAFAAERKTSWELDTKHKATKEHCLKAYSCPAGYTLKSGLVTAPKYWPAVPIKDVANSAKVTNSFMGIEAVCTCQYNSAKAPACNETNLGVYNLNPTGADYCTSSKSVTVTTDPDNAKCPQVEGSDDIYRANSGIYAHLGTSDKCYNYAKPTAQ